MAGARAAAAALLVTASLGACATARPDLIQVYPDARILKHRPVIIIPGVFGSRLRDARSGKVVWGKFMNLLTSRFRLILNPTRVDGTDLLDLPIDESDVTKNRDNLEAYDLFDGVAGRDFYREIIRTLTMVAGYRLGDVKKPQPGEDCFAFYYDWRRDTVENARLLGEAIARVQAFTRAPKVDLIAHSLGGIVARYYVRYGLVDVLAGPLGEPTYAGAENVDTVVMIGVPNEGTLDTLTSHNHGVRIARRLPPEGVFTMPASYQTLPSRTTHPFLDEAGRPLDIDLYKPELWEKYGWSAFGKESLQRLRDETLKEFGKDEGTQRYERRLATMRAFLASALTRAERLHEALDVKGTAADPVRYFAFGGDCLPTPARAMIRVQEDGTFETVTRVEDLPARLTTPEVKRLMSEPGDGSVTRSSLLALHADGGIAKPSEGLRIDQSLFLCDTHRRLTENITFQDNLLQFLLYRP